MNILTNNCILENKNSRFCVDKFNLDKTFTLNKKLYYPFIKTIGNKNYIYFRDSTEEPNPDHECTKRLLIKDALNLEIDKDFVLNLKIASHNFRAFTGNDGIEYGLGGQNCALRQYVIFKKNSSYKNYHSNKNILLPSEKYEVFYPGLEKIYNFNIPCPYYANGVNLFKFKNETDFEVLNNKLPIISGVHKGRHDGLYKNKGFTTDLLENSKNGFSAFDCIPSILFSQRKNLYYFFTRANLGAGVRYIQYCTSKDLNNWSQFNLVNINNKKDFDYYKLNYYHPNFFNMKNINQYIGILPCNVKRSEKAGDLDKYENSELYISNNCVDWEYCGVLDTHEYHKKWMVCGPPILQNNRHYFYYINNESLKIFVCSIEKNRLAHFRNKDNKKLSTLLLKKIKFSKEIRIDINIKDNGYLFARLLDENKNPIQKYSHDNFIIIKKCNGNQKLLWKNISDIEEGIYHLELSFENTRIYSVNGNFV